MLMMRPRPQGMVTSLAWRTSLKRDVGEVLLFAGDALVATHTMGREPDL